MLTIPEIDADYKLNASARSSEAAVRSASQTDVFGVALKETRLMEWTPPPKDGIDVPR